LFGIRKLQEGFKMLHKMYYLSILKDGAETCTRTERGVRSGNEAATGH